MNNLILKLAFIFALVLQMGCGGEKQTTTGTSITLEGHYNGNNLFVKNTHTSDGIGFCINEIIVNGNRTCDEVNSETFEIDLKATGVREGGAIKVEIIHEKGCEPKVLNPEVLN